MVSATHAGRILNFLEVDVVDGVVRALLFEELRSGRAF